MNPEQERARQLIGLSDGERLMVALTILVFGIGWSAIAGAWIAAASVGERLGVSGQPAIEAMFRLPTRVINPADAWPEPAASLLPGPVVYWLATIVAASPFVVGVWLWRTRRNRRTIGLDVRHRLGVDAEARFASRSDLAPLIVAGATPGRFMLGMVDDDLVATEKPIARPVSVQRRPKLPAYRPAHGSVLLVGPSQCGKSTCAITGMLEWDGPIAASSVKTDLIDETFGWRATKGECRVFDPTAVTGLPTRWHGCALRCIFRRCGWLDQIDVFLAVGAGTLAAEPIARLPWPSRITQLRPIPSKSGRLPGCPWRIPRMADQQLGMC